MATNDDDDTFDAAEDGDMLDNIGEVEITKHKSKYDLDARRKLERLKEDKELERLLNGVPDEWYDDLYDGSYRRSYDDSYDDSY